MSAPNEPPGRELRRARSLVADLDAVAWELDAATMAFTFVSEGARALFGHDPAAWTDDPGFWADHVHPADRDRIVGRLARVASAGGRLDEEYRFRTVEGVSVWVRDVAHAVKDLQGRPLVVRGLTVPVTGRDDLEADRERSDERFRRVVEHLPAIVYLGDAAAEGGPGRLRYVSPQVETILGFAPEDWLADPAAWARQLHPEDRARVREAFDRVARGDGDLSVEYRLYARDGGLHWFRDEATLVRDEAGVPRYWQGVMIDVTVQRRETARADRRTDELAEARAREQALIEQIPAVVYIDPLEGGATSYISPQVEAMLGTTPAEWYADAALWSRLVHPEDRARLEVEPDDAEFAATYRLRATDGRTVWVQDRSQLVHDRDGTPRYWLGVLIDVTEQHRLAALERELDDERREAERLRTEDEMKTTFLQAVSHDLRTPLAAILGLSITLERDDLDLGVEETRDLAHRISANARKLDGIVTDFLDLERLRQGLARPRLERLDLGALIRDLVATSQLVAERRLAMDVAPLVLEADRAMVSRIVENLLANAVKHTPGDSRIWVRLERADEGALLAVEDDGPGIAAVDREAIFQPYRQGATVAAGSGVGLALVRRFAELHGGSAWVEPREGGGSSFRVLLAWRPADAPATDGDQPAAADSPADNQA